MDTMTRQLLVDSSSTTMCQTTVMFVTHNVLSEMDLSTELKPKRLYSILKFSPDLYKMVSINIFAHELLSASYPPPTPTP